MSSRQFPFGRARAAVLSGGAVLLLAGATRVPQSRAGLVSSARGEHRVHDTTGSVTKGLESPALADSISPEKNAEALARQLEPKAFDESITRGSSVIGLLFDSAGVVVHHSRLSIPDSNEDLFQFMPQLFPNAEQALKAPFSTTVRVQGIDGRRHVDVFAVFLRKPETLKRARRQYEVSKPATQIPGTGMALYPPTLRAAKVEGEVIAEFVVNEDGKPDSRTLKILKATNGLFAASVAAALPKMRYVAAEADGEKVKQVVQQAFVFKFR